VTAAFGDTVDHVLGTVPSAIEIADYTLMLKLVRGHFGTTLMPASAIAAGPAGRSGRRCPAALEPVRRHQRHPITHRRHDRRAPRAQPGGLYRQAARRGLRFRAGGGTAEGGINGIESPHLR
jgi:hypothetical protein